MSAHKGSRRVNPDIVVGSGKSRRRLALKSRLVLLGAAGTVLLAVIIVVSVLALHHSMKTDVAVKNTSKTQSAALPKGIQTPEQRTDAAVNAKVENPDFDAANTQLNIDLQNAKTNKEKADVYVKLASVAVQQGNYQQQVDDDLQAIKLDKSRADLLANNLADAYYQLHDSANALKYYQQALKYYQAQPDNFSGKQYFVNQVNAKIAELQ